MSERKGSKKSLLPQITRFLIINLYSLDLKFFYYLLWLNVSVLLPPTFICWSPNPQCGGTRGFRGVTRFRRVMRVDSFWWWCSVAQSCPTLCVSMGCSTPGFPSFTISWSLLKLMFLESVMPSNHLILCHPLLLLPSVFPSIRVFYSESALHIRRPKDCSFSFEIRASNEQSGLISSWLDWFNLLAVQGTLKCLYQHHSSKESFLQHSAFFTV